MTSSAPAARGPSAIWRGAVVCALAFGLLPSGVVRAQGTKPLRKADLVRVLAAGTLSAPDIVALVRRNCVTFRPTARDRADLRAAGADAAVLAALDQCVRARLGSRPPAPPVDAAGLRVLAAPRISAEVGTAADVLVRLLRGATPQVGAQLVLRGLSAVPGSLAPDPLAVTNARGYAHFRIPVGTTAGTYRLTVALPTGPPAGPTGQIELVTSAARAARAEATPAEVALREGAPTSGAVTITVTDTYGNRVAGASLELRPATAELVGALPPRTTDDHGQAAFALSAAVRRGGEVGVFVRGVRIGALVVRVHRVVLSAQRTQFTRGTDQRGAAGTRLAQPLVFEVHDSAGAPVPGQMVAFAATGADVAPATAPTDSSGGAQVRVTLGGHAGPVVVTARVGTLTRTATVYADPGPPRELMVARDGTALTGPVAVRSRDVIVLRVVARDAYGNETPLAGFTAGTSGPAIRIKAASASGSQAVVTLEPRRSGVGDVLVRGSGLEARVPVQVTLPAALTEGWVLGVRGSWSGFSYAFKAIPYIQGRPGVRGELFAGRAFSPRLRLELTGALGSLKADSATREVSVALMQGYVRAEYALVSEGAVVPLISLGGGGFRIKSPDARHLVYHTSYFWLAGAGVDARLGPSAIAEVRVETQQLNELNSLYVNGHVGALTVVEAGLRLTP